MERASQTRRVVITATVSTTDGPRTIELPAIPLFVSDVRGDGAWDYREGKPVELSAGNIATHGGMKTTIEGGEWQFDDPLTQQRLSFECNELVFSKSTANWPEEAVRQVPQLRFYDALIRALRDVRCDPVKKRAVRERWTKVMSERSHDGQAGQRKQ